MNPFWPFIQKRANAVEIPVADALQDIFIVDRRSVTLVDFALDQLGDVVIAALPQIFRPVAINEVMVFPATSWGTGLAP